MISRGIVLLLTATVCSVWGTSSPAQAAEPEITVLSYNVKVASASPESIPWPDRRDEILTTLQGPDATIIGVQEARRTPNHNQPADLITGLAPAGYSVAAAPPNYESTPPPQGPGDIDWTDVPKLIFYKSDRFAHVTSAAIELVNPYRQEDGPTDPGECAEASDDRSFTWALLQDLQVDTRYIVVNTHLTPMRECWAARNHQAQQIQTHIRWLRVVYGENPVVVMGDFNVDDRDDRPVPDDTSIRTMETKQPPISGTNAPYTLERAWSWDTVTHQPTQGTHLKNWPAGRADWDHGNRLDYVFLSRRLDVSFNDRLEDCYATLKTGLKCVTPSDHFPVLTTFSNP